MTGQASDHVPTGWRLAKIGELFESWGGHTPSKANQSYWGPGLPWISSKEVKSTRLKTSTYTVTQKAIDETGLRVCPVGSVLVVVRSGILAHTLPVSVTETPVTINQDLKAFYSDEPFLNEWLALFLRMSAHQLLASSRRDGTTVQSVQYPILKNTVTPVPPIEDRRLIIEAIDTVFDKRSAVPTRLASARRAIERFRQAVLSAACSGRLSTDWRPKGVELDWQYTVASEVCAKVQSGGTPRSGFTDEPGIPFLKVYNIVDQQVDFAYRPQFVPTEVHRGVLKKSIAYPGDVIMNIVGPPLGKVAIIPDTYPEWNLNQAITIFRPGPAVLGEWLFMYLCSGSFMDDKELVTRGSAGQSNISLTQCRNLVIPVPSIDEQREIIHRTNSLLATSDQLLDRIEHAYRAVERSTQAVLAKAFRGELIPGA